VIGREKHLYSIYQKMRAKKKSFSEIMDIYAFRIVVDSVDRCYRVLGCIHSAVQARTGRVQGLHRHPQGQRLPVLHTVTMGMHGVPIEIQIRTHEMEDMANNGIAAHWLYKTDSDSANGSHARARQWVQGLLEMQQRAGNSLEFIENVKIDLFPDEIYVFTPKGHIMELPRGATAVDFAYAVHTELGNSCVACRINRRLAPLSEPLQSGQTVEVITAAGARPNPSWFNYAVTAKARSNIRHFLKQQTREDAIALGRRSSTSPCADGAVNVAKSSRRRDWPATSRVPASPPSTTCSRSWPRAGACPAWSRHSSPASSTRKARCRSRQRLTAGDSRHRGLHGHLRSLLPAPAG
jgi:guanosine-3',5'-bis(diphosphate) 3'-pyrophosphohydrolase